MQTFISKYGLAAHLAFLAVTPLFLSPFCATGTVALTLLWMSLVGAVWTIMEPSRRNGERLHEARIRVRKAIVCDPVFWLFILLACYAATRLFNGDIIRLFDTRGAKWVLSDPKTALFPRAADGMGYITFATSVALGVLVVACRQSLGKSGRLAMVSFTSGLAGATALVLVTAARTGHETALSLAGAVASGSWPEGGLTAASPLFISSPGNAFGLAFLGAVVAAAGLFECRWNRLLLLFAFAMGASFAGLFYFATPAVLFLHLVLGVLAIGGCCLYLALTQRLSVLLKFAVALVLAAGVLALVITALAPREMTDFRLGLLKGCANLPEGLFSAEFWTRRAELSLQAKSFWTQSPWLGQGIGSFPLNLWLAGAAKTGLLSDGPLNGWWQLLAERGLMGLILVGAPLGFMTVTLVWRIIRTQGHVFYPIPVLGVVGVLVTVACGFVGCSIWRPDTLLTVGAFYALAASSFPAPRKPAEDDEDDEK